MRSTAGLHAARAAGRDGHHRPAGGLRGAALLRAGRQVAGQGGAAQIDALDKALDQFRIDVGRYPTTRRGSKASTTPPADEPAWGGPYLKKAVPLDPWGRPYVYESPGTHGDVDLYSYGKDGRPGGTGENADLTNW